MMIYEVSEENTLSLRTTAIQQLSGTEKNCIKRTCKSKFENKNSSSSKTGEG